MIVSIAYIKLKTPFHFFKLAKYAMHILKQLKADKNCKAYKQTGIWKDHYTMSLWENEEDMMAFVRSNAHLEAMKISSSIAATLKFKRLNQDIMPNWKEAKLLLHEGKI